MARRLSDLLPENFNLVDLRDYAADTTGFRKLFEDLSKNYGYQFVEFAPIALPILLGDFAEDVEGLKMTDFVEAVEACLFDEDSGIRFVSIEFVGQLFKVQMAGDSDLIFEAVKLEELGAALYLLSFDESFSVFESAKKVLKEIAVSGLLSLDRLKEGLVDAILRSFDSLPVSPFKKKVARNLMLRAVASLFESDVYFPNVWDLELVNSENVEKTPEKIVDPDSSPEPDVQVTPDRSEYLSEIESTPENSP